MNALSDVVQSKKKRPVTEARRQQCREAQKRYREKQKRRLAELSSLASARQPHEPSQPESMPSDLLRATWLPSLNGAPNLTEEPIPVDARGGAANLVEWNGVQSSSTIEGMAADPNWAIGIPLDGLDTFEPNGTCLSSESVLREGGDHDCQVIAANAYPPLSERAPNTKELPESMQSSRLVRSSTSFESSGSSEPSVAWRTSSSFPADTVPAPSIPRDSYIRVHRYSFLNAFRENAMMLGYTFDCVTTHACHLKSLWCPTSPQSQLQVGIRVDWKENIPAMMKVAPDLAPTMSQLQHPHGLYIDIFPFSEFREKMLALRAVRPKVFEEEDLMRDIDTDGAICCWGPTPWEQRSWEVQPWFLRKWWMLTGGEEGEMGTLSRWWRRLRGEI